MDGVQLPQGYRAIMRRQFTFHHYVPGIPLNDERLDAFAAVSDFSIEDHCVDLYYWFDKSSKQKSILKEYYDFCDQDYQEVIKYISTRWLCSERWVNPELKK